MSDAECRQWIDDIADSGIINAPANQSMSLSTRVLRFYWNGKPSVAVGPTVSSAERINLILSGLAWLIQDDALASGLNAIVCTDAATGDPQWVEHLDALATQAADLVHLVNRPSLALYPKLGTGSSSTPWQIRLDGLDVGRVGTNQGRLKLATSNLSNPGEPRETWRSVLGMDPFDFTRSSPDDAVELVRMLIAAWGGDGTGAVLAHGRPEHALEAHVLSGRLQLITSDSGPLFPIAPIRDGAISGAQFPTIWGADGKARYLDALLKDEQARPWAIELKDQYAGGGHGSYLRHGISQAVLYRHFIRATSALDPWFQHLGLVRSDCQAAVAFPAAAPVARARVEQHRRLAQLFDVDVIEFDRP